MAYELAIDVKGERALAYQANDELVELFEIGSGSRRTVFLPAEFRLASFNPGGEAIVASLTDLWVIDVASSEVASRATFPASTSDVAISPDERRCSLDPARCWGHTTRRAARFAGSCAQASTKNGATRCSAATDNP